MMVELNPAADYIHMARKYLEDSSSEFAAQDFRQASEKLWGAASQAIMAVASARNWEYASHRAMQNAVRRLADEAQDPGLVAGFLAAERFHINFYHGGMELYQISNAVPLVHEFVEQLLALADHATQESQNR